jgi:hypothetical protein
MQSATVAALASLISTACSLFSLDVDNTPNGLERSLLSDTGGRETELEYTGQTSGVEVSREWYPDCATGGSVQLYRLDGVEHIWPQGGFSASWAVADFLGLR